MTPRLAFAGALVGTLAICTAAIAGPRVLVVRDPDTLQASYARVTAELTALGFDVRTREAPPSTELELLTHEEAAAAAIRIKPGLGIEVVVQPRGASPVVHQELLGAEPDAVTLRAVELIRASLLEVAEPTIASEAPRPRDASGSSRPPSPPSAAAARHPPGVTLEVGPTITWSAGGIGAAVHGSLVARWSPRRWLALGFGALLPLHSGEVRAPEGRATISLVVPSLEADALTRWSWLELRGGLGLGGVWARMTGSPATGYAATAVDVVTGLVFVRGSVGARLGPVRLWIDARAAVGAPRTVVAFAGQPVAAWGRPALIGGLGLEVGWF